MPEWLLVLIGMLAALVLLAGVFAISFIPRKRESGIAPRSGRAEYQAIAGESTPAHHSGHGGD